LIKEEGSVILTTRYAGIRGRGLLLCPDTRREDETALAKNKKIFYNSKLPGPLPP
jgi:hypothetical protein